MGAGKPRFAITGLGLRCAVGQNATQGCAAVRAGIMRFEEWIHFAVSGGSGEAAVIGAAVRPDPGDRSWVEKFDELATQPFLEALWTAKLYDLSNGDRTRLGVYLATPPAGRAGVDPDDASAFEEDLANRTLLPVEPTAMTSVPAGHAAGLLALQRALNDLAERTVDVAVVGGVDSLLHTPYLYAMLEDGRLKTTLTASGLVPGEAGAFVVVEERARALARGVPPQADVSPVTIGREPASPAADRAGMADALTEVLRATLAALPCGPGRIERIVNDLNGERWRFLEWATAEARALAALPPDWRLWHPADSFGDVGAASGVAHLCLGVRAFQRGYAVGDAVMICSSSETGERGAACVMATSD